MAIGKKTGGKNFEKGRKATGGRKKGTKLIPAVVKEMNRLELEKIINKYIHLSEKELKKIKADPDLIIFDSIVIGILQEANKKQDQNKLNFILDRLGILVKKQIDITSNDETIGANVSDEQLEKIAARLLKK